MNLNSTIDLANLLGARYQMVASRSRKEGESDADYAKSFIPCLCLPVAANAISIRTDSNGVLTQARISVSQWQYNEQNDRDKKFLDSCMNSALQRKRENNDSTPIDKEYDLPYARLSINFTEDHTKKLREQICKRLKSLHSEWASQEDMYGQKDAQGQRLSNELTYEISKMMPSQLGLSYRIKPKEQVAQPAAPIYGVNAQVPFAPTDNDYDDLPF